MDGNEFKMIVMKEKKGKKASLWRFLFRFIALFYSVGVRVNRFLFDSGCKRTRRLDVPVVSVGNLTLGGTGKTPTVAYLIRAYLTKGKRPGVLSRGYKSENFEEFEEKINVNSMIDAPDPGSPGVDGKNDPFRKRNDEAAELAQEFPTVPHFLSPRRYEAGRALLKSDPKVNRLILDDAFQHRRLARDLDIVLLDSLNPFGTERLFPAGFLREPLSALKRADVVLLSRADLVTEGVRTEIRHRVREIAPNILWGETAAVPIALVRFMGNDRYDSQPFDRFRDDASAGSAPFLPFCGIGNPEGFFRMMKMEKIPVADGLSFPDHARLTEDDLTLLVRQADEVRAAAFLTTMKDLVKLRRSKIGDRPVWGIKIDLKFLSGEREFLERLP